MYLADLFEVSKAMSSVPEGDGYVTVLPKGLLPWVELNIVVERQDFEGIYLQAKQNSPDAEPVLNALMARGNREFRERFAETESVKRAYTELISEALASIYGGKATQPVAVSASISTEESQPVTPVPATPALPVDSNSVFKSSESSQSAEPITAEPPKTEVDFKNLPVPESTMPPSESTAEVASGQSSLFNESLENLSTSRPVTSDTGLADLPAPEMEEPPVRIESSNPYEEEHSYEPLVQKGDVFDSMAMEDTIPMHESGDDSYKYSNPLTGSQSGGFPDLPVDDTMTGEHPAAETEDSHYDSLLGSHGDAPSQNVVMTVVETGEQQAGIPHTSVDDELYVDAKQQWGSGLEMNIEPDSGASESPAQEDPITSIEPSQPMDEGTSEESALVESITPDTPLNEGVGEEAALVESITPETPLDGGTGEESVPVEPEEPEISLDSGTSEEPVTEKREPTPMQVRQQEFVTLVHAVEAGNAGVAVCPDWAHECLNSFVGMRNDFLDCFQSVMISQIFESAGVTAEDFYEEVCKSAYRGAAIQESTEVPETNEQFLQLLQVCEVESLWWCYLENMDNAVHVAKLFADLIYEG